MVHYAMLGVLHDIEVESQLHLTACLRDRYDLDADFGYSDACPLDDESLAGRVSNGG